MGQWALDSGGYTELNLHGRWETTEAEYVAAVTRYAEEIGNLAWAAPMDWMCEPWMVAKTGLTVIEHQRRTVENYISLGVQAPQLPFIPVLQGYSRADYDRCIELYRDAGVDLWQEPIVGLGTMCRRQGEREIDYIVSGLALAGLRLHGFGIKTRGLRHYGWALTSADSLAWSARARRAGVPMLPDCIHKTCANCFAYAHWWRENRVLPTLIDQQPRMLSA